MYLDANGDPHSLFRKLLEHMLTKEVLATSTAKKHSGARKNAKPLDQNVLTAIKSKQEKCYYYIFIC